MSDSRTSRAITQLANVPVHMRSAAGSEAGMLSGLALRSKALWGYDAAFLEACRDELTFTADQIESKAYRFRVGEAGGVLVGFHALRHVSRDEAELEALFVEPSHVGRGVGRALIHDARTVASEWNVRRIWIQGDPNAETFYLAAGARQAGWRASGSIEGRMLPLFVIEIGEAEAA